MKKVALMALVAIFTLSLSVTAQNRDQRGGPAEMRWSVKDRVKAMEKQLELTADQKTKVEALLEQQDAKSAEQFAKMRENREEFTEERREEMMALRSKTTAENDAELEKIIGKEKLELWKTYRDEQTKKMREGGPQRRDMNMNPPRIN